jgi:hypothetical protein
MVVRSEGDVLRKVDKVKWKQCLWSRELVKGDCSDNDVASLTQLSLIGCSHGKKSFSSTQS